LPVVADGAAVVQLGELKGFARAVVGDDDVPGAVDGVGRVGRRAVNGKVLGVLALLVADVLADGQAGERRPGHLQLAAVDLGLGHIGDLAATAALAVVFQALDLLVLVVVEEHRAVQAHAAVEQVALEAGFVGDDDLGLEGRGRGAVVGGEAARLHAARDAGVEHGVAVDAVLGAEAAADFRKAGLVGDVRAFRHVDAARARGGQAAVLVLVAQARDQVDLVGQLEAVVGEHADGLDVLVVGGVDQVGVGAAELGVEAAVEAFVGIVAADHPVQPALVLRRQAQLLREHLQVVVEVDVGLVEAGAVPVVVFRAAEGLVGGDRVQLGPAEVGLDADVDVEAVVVATGLGAERAARDGGHLRRQFPAGDPARGVGRIGHRAVERGVGTAQAHAQAVGLVAHVGRRQVDGDVGRGQPGQAAAQGGLVDVAQALPGVAVVLPGAALFGDGGQATQQDGIDLARDVAFQAVAVVGAVFGAEAGVALGGGGVGDDVHRAAGGVAAVQRALRAAQHLDARDVEHRALGGDRVGVGHFVDIDADRRGVVARVFAGADAADAELRLAAAELAVDLHVGHDVLDVVDDVDALFLQRLAADHAERDAHVLAGLRAALGGDDDVFEHGGVGRGGGRFGRRRLGDGEGQYGAGRADEETLHGSIHRAGAREPLPRAPTGVQDGRRRAIERTKTAGGAVSRGSLRRPLAIV